MYHYSAHKLKPNSSTFGSVYFPGNAFLVNLSVTMLLVTLVVMPSLAAHVLADVDISPQVTLLRCNCV